MTDQIIGAVIVFGSLTALAAWTIRHVLRWANEEVERHVQTALATEADDWGEPSRRQVEWETHVAEAVALAETPIYHDLRREQFVADAMAEIDELTKGAAS